MKQLDMWTRLKSGMKSKPILILSAIIVVLLLISMFQSWLAKKQHAELKLAENNLLQCQFTNSENQSQTNALEAELNRCVGIRQSIKHKLTIAEFQIRNFSATNEDDLNDRIEEIKKLPPQDCDHITVDPAVVRMWPAQTDR